MSIDLLDDSNRLPAPLPGESEADYFRRLLQQSIRAKEVYKVHERWKLHHMIGLRRLDYMHRIMVVLGELLRSDFLSSDFIDTGMPKQDRELAVEELKELGFDELLQIEGAEWKFALLKQLRNPETSRIEIKDHNAGFYIKEMYDVLTLDDVEAFCRFVTFTRLVYQEMGTMKEQASNSALEEIKNKMHEALRPLAEHVNPDYADRYNQLWDDILQANDLSDKLREKSPHKFEGKYNQKMVCNIVGLLCSVKVYELSAKKADELIYKGISHYKYINNFAARDSTDSVLTPDDIKAIKKLIEKHS